MNRPKTYTVAAILQLLISLASVVWSFPILFQGAAAVEQSGDQPPFFIIVISFGLGLLGLVSAYGVWRNQKWGVIPTIVLSALNAVSALPATFGAPTVQLQIFVSVGASISVVIIVLLLWPKSRLATS